jgi:GTPase
MASKRKLPLVAICGRPNVGKSTLFNRMARRQRAIVHSEEGVTRDRTYATVTWGQHEFEVIDTGGIVENPTDPITHGIQDQVHLALEEARVIVFVVDGQQEITRVDEDIRDALFRHGKPVILTVNKLDNERLDMNKTDFYAMGLGDPYAISSSHGLGIEAIMDAITEHLPPPKPRDEEAVDSDAAETGPIGVAVVGKPNVGKSSFINAILNEERAIVDDKPGTTRDALDIDFHWKGKEYLLIDTAGLRKKAGIKRDVERFSVARSLRAIRRADVCLVMIDATEGITEQDKRVVNYVKEQGTAMILVYTKWDLIEDKEAHFKSLSEEIALKAPFLKYVPYVTISNTSRQRLFTTFEHIDSVAAEAEKRISTGQLNRFMEDVRANAPASMHKGQRAKILYATQTSVKPTTFVLFVNQKRLFHFSYIRFVQNRLREKFGFSGVPINIEIREGKPK